MTFARGVGGCGLRVDGYLWLGASEIALLFFCCLSNSAPKDASLDSDMGGRNEGLWLALYHLSPAVREDGCGFKLFPSSHQVRLILLIFRYFDYHSNVTRITYHTYHTYHPYHPYLTYHTYIPDIS